MVHVQYVKELGKQPYTCRYGQGHGHVQKRALSHTHSAPMQAKINLVNPLVLFTVNNHITHNLHTRSIPFLWQCSNINN